MALDLCQNFASAQHLEINFTEFGQTLFFIMTRSMLGLLPSFFANYNRVMALDWRQNFVSAQYLEKKLTDVYQNVLCALILTRSRL